jgi:hypothetical protein
MLTEPCRSVFMKLGYWIVIERESLPTDHGRDPQYLEMVELIAASTWREGVSVKRRLPLPDDRPAAGACIPVFPRRAPALIR